MTNGVYIGTVIANDDPEKSGRVKVRIEGITAPIGKKSLAYKFPAGENVSGSLEPNDIEISRLSTVWALVATPILGESSMGKYNRNSNVSSNADFGSVKGMTGVNNVLDEEGRETNIGAQWGRMADGFSVPAVNIVQKANPYSYSNMPNTYPNAAKGVFSVLGIGTKVVIGFVNGSYRDPVVLGKINTQTEFNQIYGPNFESYNGVFENTGN